MMVLEDDNYTSPFVLVSVVKECLFGVMGSKKVCILI